MKTEMNASQKVIVAERNRIRKRLLFLDKCREILRSQEKANQKKCLHDGETNYYQDPAGGNDSWTECCLCGGAIPRKINNELQKKQNP